MNILQRFHTGRSVPAPGPEARTPPAAEASPPRTSRAVPATRTSVVWAGVWAGTAVAITFIVFMLQNTAGVRVSFLGLHGTLPLAVALLIATVTGVLLTLVLGTARISQMRHLARRRR